MRTSLAIMAAAAIGLGGAIAGSSPASAQSAQLVPLVEHGTGAETQLVFHGGRHAHRGQVRGHRGWHRDRHSRHRDRGSAAAAGIIGFGAGAILGQALTQPRTQYQAYAGLPAEHVRWCQQRYRSYDIGSDSFLSYDGNRYPCNSPYVAR